MCVEGVSQVIVLTVFSNTFKVFKRIMFSFCNRLASFVTSVPFVCSLTFNTLVTQDVKLRCDLTLASMRQNDGILMKCCSL